MSKKSKWTTAGAIGLGAVLMVVLTWSGSKTETLLYYEPPPADQCYSVAIAYHRYAVKIDPEDFGIDTEFRITKVFASASIQTGLPVPLLISDALPSKYPDSSLTRQDITFTNAWWDTFNLEIPLERKQEFWVQIVYTSWAFNPFSESVAEDSVLTRKRNLVETSLGWGPNECNMAIGVEIETPAGIRKHFPGIPKTFVLYQNYPNPFNPVTTIGFSLEQSDHVILSIYSIRGNLVETLLNKPLNLGSHEVIWKGGDNTASGVYFYQLVVGGRAERKRMLLTK